MIYGYFINSDKYIKSHNICFINCSFSDINNSDTQKLLEFSAHYINYGVEYLEISLIYCLFDNNYYVKPITIESYNDEFGNPYVSVLIKNVTVSSNINGHMETITTKMVMLYLENVIFRLNTFDRQSSAIIATISSYVQFSDYNEFSYNIAFLAISATALHNQENTTLNFTLNKFYTFTYNEKPITDDINMCIIQYISENRNLDYKFQQGQKLNYSIVFTKNSVTNIETLIDNVMHCAWDSSSAFINSVP